MHISEKLSGKKNTNAPTIIIASSEKKKKFKKRLSQFREIIGIRQKIFDKIQNRFSNT